jgi:hypothetical protein
MMAELVSRPARRDDLSRYRCLLPRCRRLEEHGWVRSVSVTQPAVPIAEKPADNAEPGEDS